MKESGETSKEQSLAGSNGTSDFAGLRKCGLFFSVVLAFAAWSFLWQERSGSFFFTLSAFILLSVTLFTPRLLQWPYRLWAMGADVFGLVLMQLVLTLVFFLILTPAGLLSRLLKRDFLSLKMPRDSWSYWDRGPDSYWIPRKKARGGVERYEKQF